MNIASAPGARLGIVIALVVASVGALAQDADGGRGKQMAARLQERFVSADANHDGRLTQDEAKAGMPFVYKHFDEIDKAKASAITMADIAAFARDQSAAAVGGRGRVQREALAHKRIDVDLRTPGAYTADVDVITELFHVPR